VNARSGSCFAKEGTSDCLSSAKRCVHNASHGTLRAFTTVAVLPIRTRNPCTVSTVLLPHAVHLTVRMEEAWNDPVNTIL
jgi:hypothetical protein